MGVGAQFYFLDDSKLNKIDRSIVFDEGLHQRYYCVLASEYRQVKNVHSLTQDIGDITNAVPVH